MKRGRSLLLCDKRIPLMVPQPLNAAVSVAAAKNLMSVSAYIRQSLVTALRKEGVPIERKTAA